MITIVLVLVGVAAVGYVLVSRMRGQALNARRMLMDRREEISAPSNARAVPERSATTERQRERTRRKYRYRSRSTPAGSTPNNVTM